MSGKLVYTTRPEAKAEVKPKRVINEPTPNDPKNPYRGTGYRNFVKNWRDRR